MTLSSPHLGYQRNVSPLVKTGMWVLNRMRQCASLDELAMTDTVAAVESSAILIGRGVGFGKEDDQQEPATQEQQSNQVTTARGSSTTTFKASPTEPEDPRRNTLLYRLACDPSRNLLHLFARVVLVSSFQDSYAPYESARIEVAGDDRVSFEEGRRTVIDTAGDAGGQAGKGAIGSNTGRGSSTSDSTGSKDAIVTEMANSLLHKIVASTSTSTPASRTRLYRVDVNFAFSTQSLDTFLGRAAHIQFLESHAFLKTLIQGYSFLFS
ncbi:unnamed protein product [Amoebophrya sp. A25]|nr:unnamed protein product [Amoebophrya sp. A25]|eukprot:GSA25T00023513001.1